MIDTYLLGANGLMAEDPIALDCLQVGACLDIRRGRPDPARRRTGVEARHLEVHAPDGRPLGYLPPDDSRVVAELLEAGACATARVTGLVPAFRRLRVQLAIEIGPG